MRMRGEGYVLMAFLCVCVCLKFYSFVLLPLGIINNKIAELIKLAY